MEQLQRVAQSTEVHLERVLGNALLAGKAHNIEDWQEWVDIVRNRQLDGPARSVLVAVIIQTAHDNPVPDAEAHVLHAVNAAATDPDWFVRMCVANYAWNLGDEIAVPILEQLAQDADEDVAGVANDSLKDLRSFRN